MNYSEIEFSVKRENRHPLPTAELKIGLSTVHLIRGFINADRFIEDPEYNLAMLESPAGERIHFSGLDQDEVEWLFALAEKVS